MAKNLVEEITKQVVNTTSLFKLDDDFQDDRYCRVRIAAMHSGKNRNNSVFDLKVIKAAKDTFANIPILAEVREHEDKDGNKYLDYTTHAMHLEEDYYNKDELRVIYDEKIVGLVPESNDFEIVHDEETGNDYVYVTAFLLRDYGNYVCDILEQRGGQTDVSMEIQCDDISINAKDNSIVVNKMTACAITLLGADTQPGMAKANAQMFSLNEKDRQTQLIELLSELNEKLDNFNNKEITRKEVNAEMKKNFKEDNSEIEVQAESKETASEDVVFEDTKKKKKTGDDDSVVVSDKEDKSLDNESKENEDNDNSGDNQNENSENNQNENSDNQDEDTEENLNENSEENPDNNTEDNGTEDNNEDNSEVYSVNYTVSVNGEKKDFSVSLRDKLSALTTLVNDTYSESDLTWYDVDVYDEEKLVLMHDWWNNKHYRQSYSVKKDTYSLKGDRTEVFVSFLSADEQNALEQMKSNYAQIQSKLASYEAEPEKMSILNSDCYSQISDTEAFKNLMKQETHFDMTVEDVQAKADAMLLEFAKTNKIEFSSKEDEPTKKVGMKLLPVNKNSGGRSRYGGLFSKSDN